MREFSYLNEKYVNKNYLKYLRLAEKDMLQHYDIRPVEMQVMLFAYEYFTEEAKMNYKHRYGLTPKARHLVQRFYRKIEGEESIKIFRE